MAVTITGSGSGGTAATSSQTVTLPGSASTSGILIVLSAETSGVTFTQTSGTTGWTELWDEEGQSGWWKEVGAGEANPSFDLSAADECAYVVWRVTGYQTSQDPYYATAVNVGTSAAPQSPTVTLPDNYTGAAFVVYTTDDGRRVASPPVEYADGSIDSGVIGSGSSSTRAQSAAAYLSGVASVSSTPWTLSGITNWRTQTVFIRQSGSGAQTITLDGFAVAVIPGGPVVLGDSGPALTHRVRIDWDNDGFSSVDDVTDRTLARSGVVIDRGHDTSQPTPTILAAAGDFVLNNNDQALHPANTGSAYYGKLLPGRPVDVVATYAAADYPLFRGGIADYDVDPNPGLRNVSIRALGPLHRLSTTVVNTSQVYEGIDTGTAIGLVLDAAGWPSDRRQIDPGSTFLSLWWVTDTTATEALQTLLTLEGPRAMLYDSTDGDVVFHSRHHRQDNAVATFRDTGTEPLYGIPSAYSLDWESVINDVSVEIAIREPDASATLWELRRVVSVDPSDTVTLLARFTDPARETMLLHDDVSGSATVTWTPVAQGGTITITAGGSGYQGRNFRVTGVPFVESGRRRQQVVSQTSIDTYERRTLSIPSEFLPLEMAQQLAQLYIDEYATPRGRSVVRVSNGHQTRIPQVLGRDVNDRVHIIDAASGLSAPFHIERIRHLVTEAGLYHVAELDCVAATTFQVDPDELFDLAFGQLGTHKLGQ